MTRWTEEIDQVTAEATDRFGSLSSDELNWNPAPDRWSIAQNLEHLIVLNESYDPILDALADGSYRPPIHARLGFMASLFGKMLLKAVAPDRRRKVGTFPIWEPSKSDIGPDIVERFARHQEALKDRIRAASDAADSGVVIHSPANRMIVYRLETAFDIIASHEKRHLNQAKEVLELMRGGSRPVLKKGAHQREEVLR